MFKTPSFVKEEIGLSVSAVLQIGADQEPAALVLMRPPAGRRSCSGHMLVLTVMRIAVNTTEYICSLRKTITCSESNDNSIDI